MCKKLWVDFGEIFGKFLYWPQKKMISFGPTTPLGGAKFSIDDSMQGDIAAEPLN